MRPRVVYIDLYVLLDRNEHNTPLWCLGSPPERWTNIKLNTTSQTFLNNLKDNDCLLCLVTSGGDEIQQVIGLLGLDRWFPADNTFISSNYNEEFFCHCMEKFPNFKYYYIADAKRDFQIPNQLGWTTCGLVDITDEETPPDSVNNNGLSCCKFKAYSYEQFQNTIVPKRIDFVVPIMKDTNDEKTQVGTGFIVDQYLITAAHVFYNLNIGENKCEELRYKFDDREFSIRLQEAFFDGHRCERREGFSQDLLVFRVSHKGSPFCLNTGNISEDVVFESRAYYYDGNKMRTPSFNNIKQIDKTADNINCFVAIGEYGFPFKEGNSGCPIFNGDIVYGTLWKSIDYPSKQYDKLYVFIDARYINEVLQMPQ